MVDSQVKSGPGLHLLSLIGIAVTCRVLVGGERAPPGDIFSYYYHTFWGVCVYVKENLICMLQQTYPLRKNFRGIQIDFAFRLRENLTARTINMYRAKTVISTLLYSKQRYITNLGHYFRLDTRSRWSIVLRARKVAVYSGLHLELHTNFSGLFCSRKSPDVTAVDLNSLS